MFIQKKSRIITTFGHQIPGKDVENTDSVQLNPDEQGLAKSGSSNISAFAIDNSENNLKSEIFLLDSIFTVNFRNWVTKIYTKNQGCKGFVSQRLRKSLKKLTEGEGAVALTIEVGTVPFSKQIHNRFKKKNKQD